MHPATERFIEVLTLDVDKWEDAAKRVDFLQVSNSVHSTIRMVHQKKRDFWMLRCTIQTSHFKTGLRSVC